LFPNPVARSLAFAEVCFHFGWSFVDTLDSTDSQQELLLEGEADAPAERERTPCLTLSQDILHVIQNLNLPHAVVAKKALQFAAPDIGEGVAFCVRREFLTGLSTFAYAGSKTKASGCATTIVLWLWFPRNICASFFMEHNLGAALISPGVRCRHRRIDVCLWHKADIPTCLRYVRFRGVKRTSASDCLQSRSMSTRPRLDSRAPLV
jgi:hypothetical protein